MGLGETDIADFRVQHNVVNSISQFLDIFANNGASGIRPVNPVDASCSLVNGYVVGESGCLVNMHELESIG